MDSRWPVDRVFQQSDGRARAMASRRERGAIERMAGIAENVSDPVVFARRKEARIFAVLHRYEHLAAGSPEWRGAPIHCLNTIRLQPAVFAGWLPNRVSFVAIRPSRNMGGRCQQPVSARQLTRTNGNLTGSPRWSPDGTRIACDSRPDGPPIFLSSMRPPAR